MENQCRQTKDTILKEMGQMVIADIHPLRKLAKYGINLLKDLENRAGLVVN